MKTTIKDVRSHLVATLKFEGSSVTEAIRMSAENLAKVCREESLISSQHALCSHILGNVSADIDLIGGNSYLVEFWIDNGSRFAAVVVDFGV